ncbi:hypothetical protein NE237_024598 [Protea cynaroides]|uniref:Uncharacterized protein n=1 Tax=Protea cynaroides TaxID=273540 RepID=A0A9Q0H0B7_9MAGN|nr:hypothetical protein NE237_024598 [Protea cynaroides]
MLDFNVQVVVMDIDEAKQDSLEFVGNLMIQSLLMNFSEKSEVSDLNSSKCSSALTYQEETYGQEKSIKEDNVSVWSIQVNASSKDEDDDEDGEEIVDGEETERDYYYYKEEDE